jgi:SAM-dependent methyltransferase
VTPSAYKTPGIIAVLAGRVPFGRSGVGLKEHRLPRDLSENIETPDRNSVSRAVAGFYDGHGWVDQGDGSSGEDQLFRRFPPGHQAYAIGVCRRIAAAVGGRRGALLFVGCGDMPDNHVELARGFESVTCMDISGTALGIAERKLGATATYHRQSIVESPLADNLFDVAFCAHVIYHIDRDQQEIAVRQLIRLAKPGGRVIIIYANPRSVFTIPGEIARRSRRLIKRRPEAGGHADLYYHAHPLGWWRRFAAEADIHYVPWEVIGSRPARALLRGDRMPRLFFRAAAWLEAKAPWAAARLWQYPIVILDKKADAA